PQAETGTMMRAWNKLAVLAVAVGVVGITSNEEASAQSDNSVTLVSFDGFTQLRGELLDFDGGTYTIETVLGVIQVDGTKVNCEGAACPKDVLFGAEFGVYGSNTIGAELMPALLEGYADSLEAEFVLEVGSGSEQRVARIIHEDGREMAKIDLSAQGSSSGYRGIGEGLAEIAMSSRRMRDNDLSALAQAGVGELRDTENEHIIGLDGLLAIVNSSNQISSVSLEELALIFSGALTNWSQLGGEDAPINLYALDDKSGTFQTFGALVLAPFGTDISPTANRVVSNIKVSDSVAGDPNGIGVTSAAYERAARALPIRQECGILSYPTTFSMKSEEYPLSRRLYLYAAPNEISTHARQIIEFATSEAAQPFVQEAGFVDQAIERVSLGDQGERLVHGLTVSQETPLQEFRRMVAQLRGAQRVSFTLRFAAGGSLLTKKSQADIERLARLVAEGRFGNKEVLLVGFTDSVGLFDLNRGLSERRARSVEDQLRNAVPPGALDGIQITSLGFGEMLPVGCNTNPQGRGANRRVEVWLRDRS
ncbi:MAG: phosphate ABC transporter substrate-binding/OmpA family protein, partial [Paracoccaceae bacterium]